MMSPQRSWHSRVVENLTFALRQAAPAGIEAEREMSVKLDTYNRPEPDIVVTSVPYDRNRTRFLPEEVLLLVELAP